METQLQKIVQFFKSDFGFDRMLRAMFDIYLNHGRAFGAVRLTRTSVEEESAISEFFKRDYYNQALIRIGLADFERQMHKKFSDNVELGAVLAEYMGKPVEKRYARSDAQKPGTFASIILTDVLPELENTPAQVWLKEISMQTRRAYRTWATRYLTEPENIIKMIRDVSEALNNINEDKKLIPLTEFSEKFTGSPNALDFSGTHGELFLKSLACIFKLPTPFSTEECIYLHLRAGLLSYGMLSSVTVFGISAKTYDEQDDTACAHYENLNQSHILTLENMSRFASVSARSGKVFILEDPQIFAAVCTQLKGLKCTIICPACSSGFSAAFIYLLKYFRTADIPLYYAGNMDYRGLEHADKLYVEFDKIFVPWRYSHEDYAHILSEGNVSLPDVKKNLAMHNDTLASLLSHMRKTGKTATSTPLIPLFCEDIKSLTNQN